MATSTFTPNSYGPCALPLPMHSTSGACRNRFLVDFALHALPRQHAPGEAQRPGEDFFELGIAVDASPDVTDDAAQIGLEPAQASVGALELMGMGIAFVLDQRQLADPRIGLAQLDTDMRGKPDQAFSRSIL